MIFLNENDDFSLIFTVLRFSNAHFFIFTLIVDSSENVGSASQILFLKFINFSSVKIFCLNF